jgi:hypothetical protein
MQEMQSPSGETLRELFSGYRTKGELTAAMEARRAELEAQGYKFVNNAKVGRNDPCPCGSKQKFKRCCIGIVKRAGGGTFVKLPVAKSVKPIFDPNDPR